MGDELKNAKKHQFLTFKIVDKKDVVLDVVGARDEPIEKFIEALPDNEARYAVIDYNIKIGEIQNDKLVWVLWNPDEGKAMEKILYATSNEKIAGGLDVGIKVQCSTKGSVKEEIEYSLAKV